ncbi:MAG: hypothetical protein SFZ03_08410 [Candidatus Melainabacteria bacterium]|nr:hypothetical protein [Candidatus Melainabacteria bacterium]
MLRFGTVQFQFPVQQADTLAHNASIATAAKQFEQAFGQVFNEGNISKLRVYPEADPKADVVTLSFHGTSGQEALLMNTLEAAGLKENESYTHTDKKPPLWQRWTTFSFEQAAELGLKALIKDSMQDLTLPTFGYDVQSGDIQHTAMAKQKLVPFWRVFGQSVLDKLSDDAE